MRKIILLVGLFTNILFANNLPEFKKYISYSNNISLENIVKTEEMFFGTNKKYISSTVLSTDGLLEESAKGVVSSLGSVSTELGKGFLKEGLKAGATGLGIGIIIGGVKAINKSIENSKYDASIEKMIQVPFYLVEKITNDSGEVTIKRTIIIFNDIRFSNFKEDKKTLDYVKAKIKG